MIGREGLHARVLCDIAVRAGASDVRSHISTGNLTLTTAGDDPEPIAAALETGVADVIGRPELVAVRPLSWLRDLTARDHFAGFDPAEWELAVAILRHDAPQLDPAALGDPAPTVIVSVGAREVLAARPRTGRVRPHVGTLVERATGVPATSRAWSTLQLIAERAAATG
jgi:uncharacterized protein (DUF1697 family)